MPKAAPANGRRPPSQGAGGRARSQAMAPSSRRPPEPDPDELDVRLRILDGPAAGTEYAIAGAVVRLGRGDDNDIVLQDNNASRLHAEVVASRGQYVVRDLGSRNGIFVNRKKVPQQQALKNGDKITIGGTTVQFITDGGAGAAFEGGGRADAGASGGGGLKRAVLVGGAVALVLIVLVAIAGGGQGGSNGSAGSTGGQPGAGNNPGNGGTPNDGVSLGSLLGGGNGTRPPGGNGIGVDRNSNTRLGTPVVVGTPSKANE
ncbi:MAG TPA: FHA domain-containing protein, partial [bacterium]|nr:FHA domain-containing protein [bacterium]